jgi:hypothetical protein
MTHTTQTATQNDTIYIYREAESQEELEELLKLRYRAFLRGTWGLITKRNIYQIDIDVFDVNAMHFGLFIQKDEKEIPIGYVRFVTETTTKHGNWIENILKKCTDIELINTEFKFPVQVKLESKHIPILQDFIKEQNQNNFKVVEISRISLEEGVTTFKLSNLFIDFIFGSELKNKSTYIIHVIDSSEKIYIKNGFIRHNSISSFVIDDLYYLYYINENMLPDSEINKMLAMSKHYQQNKRITYNFTKQTFS